MNNNLETLIGLKLDIANSIASAMEYRKMTKSELADRLGNHKSYVTKILSGDVNFSVDTLLRVLSALSGRVHIFTSPNESDEWDVKRILHDLELHLWDDCYIGKPIECKQSEPESPSKSESTLCVKDSWFQALMEEKITAESAGAPNADFISSDIPTEGSNARYSALVA